MGVIINYAIKCVALYTVKCGSALAMVMAGSPGPLATSRTMAPGGRSKVLNLSSMSWYGPRRWR